MKNCKLIWHQFYWNNMTLNFVTLSNVQKFEKSMLTRNSNSFSSFSMRLCSPTRTDSLFLVQWAAVNTQRGDTKVPPQNASYKYKWFDKMTWQSFWLLLRIKYKYFLQTSKICKNCPFIGVHHKILSVLLVKTHNKLIWFKSPFQISLFYAKFSPKNDFIFQDFWFAILCFQ